MRLSAYTVFIRDVRNILRVVVGKSALDVDGNVIIKYVLLKQCMKAWIEFSSGVSCMC